MIIMLAASAGLYVVLCMWLGYPVYVALIGSAAIGYAFAEIYQRNRKPKGKQE
jgi:Flp pilus assembly protein TadB